MNLKTGYSIPEPKINPSNKPHPPAKPDGSPGNDDRVETGPTDIAFEEWKQLGITAPNLDRMRVTRLKRICNELQKRDYGGVLLFDPLNIRYANDSSNMQLWVTHNPSRATFVAADGYMILWDYHGCDHMSTYLPLICEHRHGAGFFYFEAGDKQHEKAKAFAQQIDSIMQEHCGGNRRLAVDKMEIDGVVALQQLGFDLKSGQEVMEHARLIKGEDEINAMRCAVATCEIAMAEMHKHLQPGIAEVELWSVLHAENIKRGGEWIETRLLNSGPRTNPWMQEAGQRRIKPGELLSFDTDLIGPYGMCSDESRTWYCGDGNPGDEQRKLYQIAYEHITTNMELLKPGLEFRDLTFGGHLLPEQYVQQRYGVKYHGVGLCDEFPAIMYPEDYVEGAFEYALQPGMVLCVEVYLGEVGGSDGIKLEEQVVITETGYEKLTVYPHEDRLMA
ncbi:MAG: dimethylsulfonioproprionate lyase DddP [Arenicellales bacterium WSBS_2016_MAG_OTU3]